MKKIIITIFLTTTFLFGLSTECQAQKAKNTKSKTPVKKTTQTTASIKAKKDAEIKVLKEAEIAAAAKKTADSLAAVAEAQKIAEAKVIEEASVKKEKEEAEKKLAKQLSDSLTNVETKNKTEKESKQKQKSCCDPEETTQVIMEMNEDGSWIKATKNETVPMPKKGTIYKNDKIYRIRYSDRKTGKYDAKLKWALEHGRKVQTVQK